MKPADIILQQMGGQRRLNVMIGAKDIFSDNGGNTLVFKFANQKRSKPNYIKITLNSMDLYDVEFGRAGKKKDPELGFSMPCYTEMKKVDGIYCDMLRELFETTTGLYLTL